jgi:hypothetical protein
MKTVMAIMVSNRKDSAEKVQKILTGWGCLIKMRLGLHDNVLDNCSDEGLLILELVGEEGKHKELAEKLNVLPGVQAKFMTLSLEE